MKPEHDEARESIRTEIEGQPRDPYTVQLIALRSALWEKVLDVSQGSMEERAVSDFAHHIIDESGYADFYDRSVDMAGQLNREIAFYKQVSPPYKETYVLLEHYARQFMELDGFTSYEIGLDRDRMLRILMQEFQGLPEFIERTRKYKVAHPELAHMSGIELFRNSIRRSFGVESLY